MVGCSFNSSCADLRASSKRPSCHWAIVMTRQVEVCLRLARSERCASSSARSYLAGGDGGRGGERIVEVAMRVERRELQRALGVLDRLLALALEGMQRALEQPGAARCSD